MEILITVMLFIAGVLGFLSYNHYESFKRVAVIGAIAAIIIYSLCWGWNILLTILDSNILSVIDNANDRNSVELLLDSYRLNGWYIFYFYISIIAVLVILYLSPNIIKDHPHNKQKQN